MKSIAALTLALCSLLHPCLSTCLAQGSLTPPGAPAPGMKTLAQIEPRTLISALPFTIQAPGSYYLTTNLTGGAGQDGITISASGVTLDLMGFELLGSPNSWDGITVSGTVTNLVVRNGSLRGWGRDGVNAANALHSRLEELVVSANGDAGLTTGLGSIISRCSAFGNVTNGIYAGYGSTVSGCTATANIGAGIATFHGCVLSGCATRNNGGYGILAGVGSLVSGCNASSNLVDGIFAGASSTVRDCVASYNTGDGIFAGSGSTVSGCTASFNSADGIDVTSDCRVVNNTCDSNGNAGDGAGVRAGGSDNRLEGNNVTDNTRGIDVDSASNLVIRNSASGNTTNYDIVANNKVGVIVAVPNSAAILGSTGGAGVGTTDPWANFSF